MVAKLDQAALTAEISAMMEATKAYDVEELERRARALAQVVKAHVALRELGVVTEDQPADARSEDEAREEIWRRLTRLRQSILAEEAAERAERRRAGSGREGLEDLVEPEPAPQRWFLEDLAAAGRARGG
ncbi:hypothetical protein Q0812_01500 [Brevundimonas sp. 2R-24]|uniref:Uncharacterized protein n=1 Tax=Peiella sedimenti TaxID=3061083 RepID=A0ABT8SHT0_9CAUL|nr:hypothetical protein [Caulobacteraceae bacterium XZ-24]